MELSAEAADAYDAGYRRGLAACHAHLETIAAALHDVSPYIEAVTRSGPPADEIIGVAAEKHVDLILMATRDRTMGDAFLTDSVANRVAQAAPVPVMMVHEDDLATRNGAAAIASYARVVVPLDGSELSCAALPVAAAMAKRGAVPMTLLRSVPPQEAMFACGNGDITVGEGPQRETWYETWRDTVEDSLRADATRLRGEGLDVATEVLTGDPVAAMLAAVEPGDIVVMASHGAGGVRSWLLGSTTQKLASLSLVPVVVVPVAERQERTRLLTATEPALAS